MPKYYNSVVLWYFVSLNCQQQIRIDKDKNTVYYRDIIKLSDNCSRVNENISHFDITNYDI